MPEDGVTLTPTVLWAQRKDRLLITIDLPNPEHPRIDLEDDGNMTFSATAGKDGEERRRYEVSLEFMHPVIAKDSKISVGNRQVFVMVMKTKEVSGRDPISHEPACSNPDTTVQNPRFAIPPGALDITKARIGGAIHTSTAILPDTPADRHIPEHETRHPLPSPPFFPIHVAHLAHQSHPSPIHPPTIVAVLRRALAAAAQGER